jgi:hypothetical protein
MPTKKTWAPQEIYQIKVTLLGSSPPIWRRLLVPADLTLEQLHDVLQAAMGWENCHMHDFRIGQRRFGKPDPNDRLMGLPAVGNERTVQLFSVLGRVGAKAVYTYDFGDGWEHSIIVEKILMPEAGLTYPLCTDGKLHGPPEDCGGIGGFYNFVEATRDPDHDEHEEMLEWIGGSFDPESFSFAAVNQRLPQMFRSARKPAAKRVAPKPKRALDGADLPARSFFPESELPPQARTRIRPDEKVPLELNDRERELILKHTFAGEELTRRLRIVPKPGESPIYGFTLDDLDDLAGHVAAEANHATNKKLQKKLQRLYDRIAAVLESYTDEAD